MNSVAQQVTFDTVISHLRKQNAKSVYWDDVGMTEACAYRGHEGRKCAAGCLIPDSKYLPQMESKIVGMLSEGHDIKLVGELQQIHDNYDINEWEERFDIIASIYNLEVPGLSA